MNKFLMSLVGILMAVCFFSSANAEEEGEISPQVGPEKGILAADEHDGFKLSPKALKNFEIKTITPAIGASFTVPTAAVFVGLEEKNLYRLRDGFFKRIDFSSSTKTKTQWSVSSEELKAGDQVVISGVGFLRIVELAAFGGASEGHSH